MSVWYIWTSILVWSYSNNCTGRWLYNWSSLGLSIIFLNRLIVSQKNTSSNLFKVLTVFFAVVVGAFGISQAGQNAEFFATAQAAAYSIYEVIDRVPPIDTASQGSPDSL